MGGEREQAEREKARREAALKRLQERLAHIPDDVSLADELIAERREEARREAESDDVDRLAGPGEE